MSLSEERRLRVKGAGLIVKLALENRVKLPMKPVVATARIMFQRFYCRQSFKQYRYQIIAATCLFLAAKIEDRSVYISHIIQAFHKQERLAQLVEEEAAKPGGGDPIKAHLKRIVPLSQDSDEFGKKRDYIMLCERVVLNTLSFDLNIDHPYSIMIDMCKEIRNEKVLERPRDLAQAAFYFMNDSMRTTLSLQYAPPVIAAGSVFLAQAYLNLEMKMEGKEMDATTFGRTIRRETESVCDVSDQIMDVYAHMESTKITGAQRARIVARTNELRGGVGRDDGDDAKVLDGATRTKKRPRVG